MGSEMNPYDSPDNPMVLLRRLHRWRMAFFGLVILLAGMLSGAAIALIVVGHIGRQATPPPVAVREMLATLGPRLSLSQQQRDQMEPILVRHMQRLDEIGQDGRAAIVEELRTLNEELATVLNEGQMRQWERLLQGLPGQIRHAPGFGPGLGPGPGPGPGGGRGMGRGRLGPGRGGQGPLRVSPNTPPVPEANAVPPDGQTVPHEGPVHVN